MFPYPIPNTNMNTIPLFHRLCTQIVGFLLVAMIMKFYIAHTSAQTTERLTFGSGTLVQVELKLPKPPKKKKFVQKIADRLHGAPEVVKGPTYKHTRVREMMQIAKEMGFEDIAKISIAHALQECGILSEDCGWVKGSQKSDNGWAIGMYQWHMWHKHRDWVKAQSCAYYSPRSWHCPIGMAELRKRYFRDHPEMTDWRGQYRRYLTERGEMLREDAYTAIRKWNWNAGDPYYNKVQSRLPLVDSFL